MLDGPLDGLWAMNLAFGSETVRPAPRARAADGAADLVVVKRPDRGCAPPQNAAISAARRGVAHAEKSTRKSKRERALPVA